MVREVAYTSADRLVGLLTGLRVSASLRAHLGAILIRAHER